MREFRFAWERFCKCSDGAVRIPVSLMQSVEWRSLSPAARATFVVLAYYAGMKEKRAFCAQGLIAHLAGIGRQRCNEALSELSRAGLITNERRGFKRTNQYTVPRLNGNGEFLSVPHVLLFNARYAGLTVPAKVVLLEIIRLSRRETVPPIVGCTEERIPLSFCYQHSFKFLDFNGDADLAEHLEVNLERPTKCKRRGGHQIVHSRLFFSSLTDLAGATGIDRRTAERSVRELQMPHFDLLRPNKPSTFFKNGGGWLVLAERRDMWKAWIGKSAAQVRSLSDGERKRAKC